MATKKPTEKANLEKETPASSAPQKKAKRPAVAILKVLFFVAIIVLLIYAYPHIREQFDKQDVKRIEEKLDKLEQKVDNDKPGKLASANRGIEKRLRKVEKAIGKIQRQLASINKRSIPQAKALAETDPRTNQTEQVLEQRVTDLESQNQKLLAETQQLPAAFTVLAQLRQAVQTSKPFASELERAIEIIRTPDIDLQAKLAKLKIISGRGVATVAELSNAFAPLAVELRIELKSKADKDWFNYLRERAREFVFVRKKNSTSAVGSANISELLYSAEQKLQAGDLSGAMQLLEEIIVDDLDVELFKKWWSRAEERRFIEEVLPEIECTVFSGFVGAPQLKKEE